MSFRRRLALSTAAAVAVVAVLGSVLAYLIVRATLREQVDGALRNQADMIAVRPKRPSRHAARRPLICSTSTPVYSAFVGADDDAAAARRSTTRR